MSKKCRCNRGCGCGIDPCRCALFLLILCKAGIINQNTGSILVFVFLLCCGFGCRQSICCNN
ncbi:hypothetical protein SH2C18_32920 [Clostridium sediminicola]|uniref:hypothetical protein n=1 Tax=Clostridium sediminicola TaxID=3114879 RepID=UPI0031F239DF